MAKRKGTGDYKIGKGRPPVHTQFKKGESGNRPGRKKGLKNRKTIVRAFQRRKHTVIIGGRRWKLTIDDIGLHHLHEEIKKGNLKAFLNWLEIVDRYGESEQVAVSLAELKREDQDILDNFAKRLARTSESEGDA